MQTTANYALKKPEDSDTVKIEDLNDNADTIDAELKKRALITQIPTAPVQSVNGKTGAVTLSSNDIKAADGSTLEAVKEDFDSHKADNTTGAHKAKNILVEDASNHFTSNPKNVENVLAELFTSADNGKTNIYNAIVGKGTTPTSKNFADLISGINAINTGKKFASGNSVSYEDSSGNYCVKVVASLTFVPSIIMMITGSCLSFYYSNISTNHVFSTGGPLLSNMNNQTSIYSHDMNSSIFYIKNTGFLFPSNYIDLAYNWIAIE